MKGMVGTEGKEGNRASVAERSEMVRWRVSSVTGSWVGRFAVT